MITVQLEPEGPITEMDEALLEKREGVTEEPHQRVEWVEYWHPDIPDRAVHRSVHVILRRL